MTTLNKNPYDLIVITGPTATGKTRLAALLADQLHAEVISADSRQVYRGMDIGTGKDLNEYTVDGRIIPVHLVDMVEPGYEYNVFEYQENFHKAFEHIRKRHKEAIMCGGTGMYIEAALAKYRLLRVPINTSLRNQLEDLTSEELVSKLSSLKKLHNTTDITDRKRLIRAIEIEEYNSTHKNSNDVSPSFTYIIFGVSLPREVIRQRITDRLHSRLKEGMISEVEKLLKKGIKPGQLKFYGLEYKYVSQYVIGEITYDQMFGELNTAIHQFSKRQMTWFRRMERNGFVINWIDGEMPNEQKISYILETLAK